MSELDETSEERKNYKPKMFVGRKEKYWSKFDIPKEYDYEVKPLERETGGSYKTRYEIWKEKEGDNAKDGVQNEDSTTNKKTGFPFLVKTNWYERYKKKEEFWLKHQMHMRGKSHVVFKPYPVQKTYSELKSK